MENASKALIIAGAILLSILIIAIGMYIYTSSQNSINEAGAQIGAQERESFNQQWNVFEGKQTGSNVKSLIQKMIANAKENETEETRLPDLSIETSSGKISDVESTITDTNVKGFQDARSAVEARHVYKVDVEFDSATSLINKIVITY